MAWVMGGRIHSSRDPPKAREEKDRFASPLLRKKKKEGKREIEIFYLDCYPSAAIP